MQQQLLMSPAHTTSLTNSLPAPHRQQFLQKRPRPTTTQLTLLQIPPHPFQTQRHTNHHGQTPALHTTRHHPIGILVQKTTTDPILGAIQHGTITLGGMNPPTTIVAILPLGKDVHVVDIVKGVPELTAITIPPHVPDGDLYDIVDVY